MKFILLLIGLAISAEVISQHNSCTLEFRGRVIDDHDETPLSYAQVIVVETSKGTIADEDGRFKLSGLCAGMHQIEIRHVGCEPITRTIKLTNKQQEYIFRLEHHHELKEVEIAAKSGNSDDHPGTEMLDSEALNLQRIEGFSSALAKLNGVTLLKSGPNITKPIIHGLFGNRVAIFNDRARLEDQQWGAEHAPAMNLAGAGNLVLVKGAQGVEYGAEAIGGAVIMEPAPFGTNRSPHGQLQLSGFTNGKGGQIGAGVSGAFLKNNRLGYQLSGSMLKSGDRNSPGYLLSNTGNEDYSLAVSLGYHYKSFKLRLSNNITHQQNGILRSAHNGNLGDMEAAINLDEPIIINSFSYQILNPRQVILHNTTQINAEIKPGNLSKAEFGYAYQQNEREEFDIRRGDRYEIPALDLRLRAHSVYARYTKLIGNYFSFKAGLDGKFIDNLSNPETGTRPIVPNYEQQSLGVFSRARFQNDKWQSELGLRIDFTALKAYKWYRASDWDNLYADNFEQFVVEYNETGTQVFVVPELSYKNYAAAFGLSRNLRKNDLFGIRLSITGRAPNSAELFSDGLHHGAAVIERGNLGLKTEHALTAEIFSAIEISRLTSSLSMYYTHFDGYIQPEIAAIELTTRGAFPAMQYTQTNAAFFGFDLNLNYVLSDKVGFKSMNSLTLANDLKRSAYLLNIPPFGSTNELEFKNSSKNNKLQTIFALGVQSRFKQTRAPQVIPASDLQMIDNQQVDEVLEAGAFDITAPPGEYHLLIARIQADIVWQSRIIQMALIGNNLLNRKYRDYLNRFRYFADEEGINVKLILTLKF